ncbi:hypothetical protein NGA_0201400 [Nannochloropsis gaditana CCMP526]|nr:hypothetical protein NGA_0201400 [Nannochloropsis gaditana CCMP526]EKU22071.1 hypothetical protein NGA_0201400 [Nannochloropsis gaditana CCMP526]|eukprot:XP_005854287.1 hypothetical protein NGA_0201400 [Nannochloropsis gaditana CCMP526]
MSLSRAEGMEDWRFGNTTMPTPLFHPSLPPPPPFPPPPTTPAPSPT